MTGWAVLLYHAVTVYVRPGVASGAQVPASWVDTSLRSPLVKALTVSVSPKLPAWASLLRDQLNVLVPHPPSSQHVGVVAVPASCRWRT